MSPTPSLDLEIVTGRGARLDRLVPEWDRLAAAHSRGFTSRSAYGLAWFDHLGHGELHVVALRRDGDLVALAPLHRRSLLGQPVLRWLGHGLGTVGQVLAADADAAHQLWTALAELGDPLQLTHVRPDDEAVLALRRHPSWTHHLLVDNRCVVLSLPSGSTTQDLRGRSSLRRLGRYRNALQREGRPFGVEVVDDLDGLRRRWPDIASVAAAADAGRDRVNLCAPPYEGFTRSVLEAEAAAGNLVVVGVLAGQRWVAHEIGVRTGGVLEQWLTRYHPDVTQYSPGHLMAEWLVDHHLRLGVAEVDQMLGENALKLAWSRQGYDVATLTAAPHGLGRVRGRLALAGMLGVAARGIRS